MNGHCIAVAWSGGRDSTALLHATLAAAQPLGINVAALHVHHGLSPNADAWLTHCERQCARWQRKGHPVSFYAERLADSPRPGQSVEAWARQARYRSLRHMALAHGATAVLLAHHRLDQAETFVLQALRGAGMPGLAGMPDSVEREGITWMRPWLNMARSDIDAYVRRHRLSHIDDDSNTDTRFARNRLRTAVWPALDKAFPEADAALADAARWAQQADACLRELADIDLASIEDAEGRALRVAPLLALSLPRRSNALRQWLRRQLGRPAEASLVERLLQELADAGPQRWVTRGGEVRHYRSRLTFSAADVEVSSSAGPQQMLSVKRAGCYDVPGWAGQLLVKRVREGGVPLAWLGHLLIKPRCGGEQFQAGLGRPARSLKKQFQSMGVPAWARAAPLFYSGGRLVFVPGLGIDAGVIGLPGQAQMCLQWLAAPRPEGPRRRHRAG